MLNFTPLLKAQQIRNTDRKKHSGNALKVKLFYSDLRSKLFSVEIDMALFKSKLKVFLISACLSVLI